jgi:hypothetical protein
MGIKIIIKLGANIAIKYSERPSTKRQNERKSVLPGIGGTEASPDRPMVGLQAKKQ